MKTKNHLKLLYSFLFTATSLSLTACGGGSSTDQASVETSRPVYLRTLTKVSSAYEPLGEITATQPTYRWQATSGATEYLLGHQDSESDTRWYEYTMTADEANCVIGSSCTYRPDDVTLAAGDKKVWWVKAKIESGWQDWSSPYAFSVTDGNVHLPHAKPISPAGEIKTISPTFTWTPGNGATQYEIGMENEINHTDWISYIISADQANCQSSQCSFKPDTTTIKNKDQHSWWVRENINGRWEDWSEGSYFSVNTKTTYTPFENTPNVTSIVNTGGKWFAISPSKREVLVDDGANNVTTVFTTMNRISPLITSITGRIIFNTSQHFGYGYSSTSHHWLYSIDVHTLKNKVILSESSVSIINDTMTNFLLVSKRHHSASRGNIANATNFYKIDSDSKPIYLGRRKFGDSFQVVSVDNAQNTIHVKLRTIAGKKAQYSLKKITDAVGVGLEDENPTYTPFKNTPNVTSIVKAGGKWFAVSSSKKDVLVDDGTNNVTTAFTASYAISPLINAIEGKVFFNETKTPTKNSRLYHMWLHSLDAKTYEDKVIIDENSIILINGTMKGFILVSRRHKSPGRGDAGNQRTVYKIDSNSKTIYLAKKHYSEHLQVESIDNGNNTIHVKIRKFVNKKTTYTFKKITNAVGVGLENE